MTITICCAQLESVWNCPDATLEKAAVVIEEAAEQGASLVCFHEQFATGWDPATAGYAEDTDGTTVSTLRELARRNSIALLGSFREVHDPLPRNTAIAIGADGRILVQYSKIHLFSPANEDVAYSPGDLRASFSIDDFCFGMAICYDLRFPELFSAYAKDGVDCMLVPASWPCVRMKAWELFIRTRALENQFFVAGINAVGQTPVDFYCGNSLVADPWGGLMSRGTDQEGLFFAELDINMILEARSKIPIHSDRREDLYKRWVHKQ